LTSQSQLRKGFDESSRSEFQRRFAQALVGEQDCENATVLLGLAGMLKSGETGFFPYYTCPNLIYGLQEALPDDSRKKVWQTYLAGTNAMRKQCERRLGSGAWNCL